MSSSNAWILQTPLDTELSSPERQPHFIVASAKRAFSSMEQIAEASFFDDIATYVYRHPQFPTNLTMS